MRVAIVGCGFVADFYMESLWQYPALDLIGVTDRDRGRADRFAAFHRIGRVYPNLDDLLSDDRVDLVLNLTNPDSHYSVSRSSLAAGKHVYSEKPFAMELHQAADLVELAERAGLRIACAPCSVLGETAQTLWRVLREERIGLAKLVYAEIDDGLVFRAPYRKWISASGNPWPYKDEFEVGCTLEHAGYYLTWMTAFFGPAVSVTAFSSCLYPDKETDLPLDRLAPDFSVACIRFACGVVARLTCSIIAPHNQGFRVFGNRGILCTDNAWDYRAPVYIRRMFNIRRKMIVAPWKEGCALRMIPGAAKRARGANTMEFCRGPAEMVRSILAEEQSMLPTDFCLHNNEAVLAIQRSLESSATYQMTTSFKPLRAMPWA